MIELKDVTKVYSQGVPAINKVSLRIEKGEFVFIVGKSGSGKSTLIKLLLKELDPTEGQIIVNGNNLACMRRSRIPKYRRQIGFVFQDFRLLQDRDVFDNIAFSQKVIGAPNRLIKRRVLGVLKKVGIVEKFRCLPNQLSGGEQQRVALARALVNGPAVLVADEPTGNLDPKNSWEIMKLLEKINNEGTTVIVVTHNTDIVEAMQKRVITMQKGIIVSDTGKDTLVYA